MHIESLCRPGPDLPDLQLDLQNVGLLRLLIASREGTPDPIQKAFAPQESARPARHERQIRLEIGEKRIKLLPVCRLLGNDADRQHSAVVAC